MTRKQQRLLLISVSLTLTASAVALALYGAQGSIIYFHSPSQLQGMTLSPQTTIRAGGLVAKDSLRHHENYFAFTITDGSHQLKVHYQGLLPDLFREGQGIIAEGVMDNDKRALIATRVLAKHDENYMPPDVAAALNNASDYQPSP